jgi:hypothetical protein
MLLKCWKSISICSQISKYLKYKSRKSQVTLSYHRQFWRLKIFLNHFFDFGDLIIVSKIILATKKSHWHLEAANMARMNQDSPVHHPLDAHKYSAVDESQHWVKIWFHLGNPLCKNKVMTR